MKPQTSPNVTARMYIFILMLCTVLSGHKFSRVTGQPSGKTSYVVVGADAGPSKLAAIKKHGLNMLDEDGFLNIIGTR